jgi:hypothetical protein
MRNGPPYPWIEFSLNIGTWDLYEDTYPDTAFDGGLIVPAGLGREILASPVRVPMQLADGSIVEAPSWRGTLEIEDHRFPVEVASMGTRYLLGRDVLDQMEVCFEFGQRIRLRFRDEPV